MAHEKREKLDGRGWISYLGVVVLILVYFGGWLGASYILDTQRPVTIVNGNSMFPTLKDGDIVILKGIPTDQLVDNFENGNCQIIVFYTTSPPKHKIFFFPGDKPIIHRIHSVVYDSNGQLVGFITKGDNNPTPDLGIVTPDRIVGTVIAGPFPYIGSILLFLQSPYGMSLMVVAIIFLLVWNISSELSKKSKKRKMKTKKLKNLDFS